MRKCTRCKAAVGWEKDFCPLCGGPLTVVSVEVKPAEAAPAPRGTFTEAAAPAVPVAPTPVPKPPQPEALPEKPKTGRARYILGRGAAPQPDVLPETPKAPAPQVPQVQAPVVAQAPPAPSLTVISSEEPEDFAFPSAVGNAGGVFIRPKETSSQTDDEAGQDEGTFSKLGDVPPPAPVKKNIPVSGEFLSMFPDADPGESVLDK